MTVGILQLMSLNLIVVILQNKQQTSQLFQPSTSFSLYYKGFFQ